MKEEEELLRGTHMRGLCTVFIVVALALPVLGEDGPGWSFSGRFQGSSNSSGLVMKADPTLGYSFSRSFQTTLVSHSILLRTLPQHPRLLRHRLPMAS
jgi:hypothetical protein